MAAAFATGLLIERWRDSDTPIVVREPAAIVVLPSVSTDLPVPSLSTQAELSKLGGSPVTAPSSMAPADTVTAPSIVPSEARARELAVETGLNPIAKPGLSTSYPIIPSPESLERLAAEAAAAR